MNHYKSGFAAVIGRPNAGKSTLINALIGQKIAIMSDKPQTTRSRILCILTQEDAQVIFLDTPGVHKPKHKLGSHMAKATEGALHGVDVVVFVVDATEKMGAGEQYILKQLEKVRVPVLLAVNKIDLLRREETLPIIASYAKTYDFAGIVPISARAEENLAASASFVRAFAAEHRCIAVVTGAIDLLTDGETCYAVRNGRAEMSRVTGTGCQLSALTAAALAAVPVRPLDAALTAVVLMGVAGEIAWSRMGAGDGNAAYRTKIIDAICCMDEEMLMRRAQVEQV